MPRRPAKPATAAYLERVAVHYLQRHPGTEARLRRVLKLRVRRSVEELDTDPQAGADAIDEVVEKLRRLGYFDDASMAARDPGELAAAKLGVAASLERLGDLDEAIAEIDQSDLPAGVRDQRMDGLRSRREDQSGASYR